jgi:predicted Zn-dependent protease
LTLHPTGTAPSVDALLERLGTGVYCATLQLNVDYQCLNGFGSGEMYDVKNGKRVARLVGGGIVFRAPQLWQNVVEIAGPATAQSTWVWSNKGQPVQPGNYTVSASPMLVKGITIRGLE